jgi:3-oxoacyl-[acyl-carrier protein] reductase
MSTSDQPICLITGASRGIGLSVSEYLLSRGYVVYGVSRSITPDAQSLIEKYSSTFFFFAADVTRHDTFKPILRNIWSSHKQLNLLVHCAGVAHGGLLSLVDFADFQYVFDVNYFSPLFISKLASRYLSRSSRSQVIFISSSSAYRFDPGTLAYASSKAAINYATKQLSFEFSSMGIRVNCIAPGVTNTSMLAEMSSIAIENQLTSSSLRKICEPQQIAAMVYFLTTSEASHVNGQVFRIDGGMP